MRELIGFCAHRANTGKTTLLEKLLGELRRRGVSAAVLKHSHHHADTHHDSSRYLTAGAEGSLFVSPTGWLLEMRPEQELPLAEAAELLRKLTGAQLVLAEGYKSEVYPKIAVCRSDVTLTLPCDDMASYCAFFIPGIGLLGGPRGCIAMAKCPVTLF
jgi:molybdopterin-guanine dinucleotide biosynthesis protein MobB